MISRLLLPGFASGKRAATLTSSFVESARKRWLSSSGAVRRKPWSWLAAFRSSPNHCGAAGRPEGPDHLHAPVAAVGHARRFSGPGRPLGDTKVSGRRVTRKAPLAHVVGGSGRSEASPTAILQDTHSVEGVLGSSHSAPGITSGLYEP
jgi:hypothetical protein